jgi:hypothetical protein
MWDRSCSSKCGARSVENRLAERAGQRDTLGFLGPTFSTDFPYVQRYNLNESLEHSQIPKQFPSNNISGKS